MYVNHGPLSFTSKIKFVDYLKFWELTEQNNVKKVDSPYTANEIISDNAAYTDQIICCTAGGISNGKRVTMFHLIPDNSNTYGFERVEEILEEHTGVTKKTGSKLNGLIIGGKGEEIRKTVDRHNHYANCKILFDKVKEFFENYNISPSIFWGHKNNSQPSHIYYAGDQDTWFINAGNSRYDNREIKDAKTLKETYDTIKISDKDKKDGIWINDKKLSEEEIAELEQEPAKDS